MTFIKTVEPTSLEDWSQLILDGQSETWDAAWFLRGVCLAAVNYAKQKGDWLLEGWLNALQETTGISHQKILRWAEEAELVPVAERALDKAPGSQIAEARKLRAEVDRDLRTREARAEP